MAPKVKVLEPDDLGHGVCYEVRPAAKGNPTVHVIVDGERLPAFRRKPDQLAAEQVHAWFARSQGRIARCSGCRADSCIITPGAAAGTAASAAVCIAGTVAA